jgi:DNA polymerase
LACGFGGALGAWRRIANDEDIRSDAEVQAIVRNWRNAHPKIVEFWQRLMRAARISIRTGQSIRVMPAPHPSIVTGFDGYALTITLPSGRAIPYPGAHWSQTRSSKTATPTSSLWITRKANGNRRGRGLERWLKIACKV